MTLNQLRSFLAVAESGSVRAAAEDLVVTQAAVSASIAALQKSLGVALVTPDGRGLRLTDAGASYARYARRILGLLDEAGRAAVAAADPERGELRIAAVTTAAEQIVPGILGGFRRRHPQTGVRLEAGNRDRVRSLLDRHQVDLVLTGRPEPAWDVVVHAVRAHELVVVAAPELSAAAKAGMREGAGVTAGQERDGLLPWLARQTWLLREPGSGTRASTDALLADLDISPPDPDGRVQRGDPRIGPGRPGRHAAIPRRGRGRARRGETGGNPRPRHAAAPRLVPDSTPRPAPPGRHQTGRPRAARRQLPPPGRRRPDRQRVTGGSE